MEPKRSRTTQLLELLAAAGPAGILNSDIATAIGWSFNSRIATLRQQGHIIEAQHIGGRAYRFFLLKAAPLPEPLPIFAAIMAAEEGKRV